MDGFLKEMTADKPVVICPHEAYWIPDPKPHPDYETYVQMFLGASICQASICQTVAKRLPSFFLTVNILFVSGFWWGLLKIVE